MANSSTDTQGDISPVAEKCGRVAFWFYGGVLITIGGIAAYLAPTEYAVLASTVIVAGVVLLILGYVLPPKLVAFLGILLPW
jgi:Na+/melibiose symporter-like transporter